MGKGKAPVTERALLRRVNRVLAKREEVMKKKRGDKYGRWRGTGDYYRVYLPTNMVCVEGAGLVQTAHELGVLKPYEQVVGWTEAEWRALSRKWATDSKAKGN